MNSVLRILSAVTLLSICSCTTNYNVIKISRTPENLKVVRECQYPVAIATGYDRDDYNKLKINCYKTLENTTNEPFAEPVKSIPGCELLDEVKMGKSQLMYFLCKP